MKPAFFKVLIGKLLECRDDDGCYSPENIRKLGRVFIGLLHNAQLVLELVDRVLKLLVQDKPGSNYDDRIEYFLVLIGIEAGKLMGQPGYRVAFSALRLSVPINIII